MYKSIHTAGHKALVAAFIEARRNAKMTQMELAKKLGWKQSLVARVESGQRRIDAMDIVLWGKALRIDPRELFEAVVSAEF
ncbi:helix-turn-helix domain-containing protein [Thalassospira alkalitolerans]|uniref:helix-turn-helix domain-containing protein n=1 Tax=Thalassospira alkalitolerans TaxID=1293890 RepID=UPI003AA9A460